MEFIIDGKKMRFQGTITVVSADNLSAQLIGGYKALNAAFRKCQNCMATNDTMQEKVRTECMSNQKCNYWQLSNPMVNIPINAYQRNLQLFIFTGPTFDVYRNIDVNILGK